ncbi:MAG: type II toxin-antitoxin system Phd/YefM family antitoxin [Elusimicrobia bacterium]|nr:type II toxin-antitoxin system Phd/YefM family antitoxin [Elusimicrobiota bacterium]
MEIDAGRNVTPISEFRKEAASILERLRKTREPLLLTQNGRSVAVVLDVEEFERREYERRFARAVGEGLRDLRQGRIISQDEMEREASGP